MQPPPSMGRGNGGTDTISAILYLKQYYILFIFSTYSRSFFTSSFVYVEANHFPYKPSRSVLHDS